MDISNKIHKKIQDADARLVKKHKCSMNSIKFFVEKLFEFGEVEVGYRTQCGSTHDTQKIYREFVKILALLRKEGHFITEEKIKHKNAYASNNEGFWQSSSYKIQKTLKIF